MPASLSPAFTANPPLRVAIMTSSVAFTAARRALSTRKTPSHADVSSFLPSEGSLERMLSVPQSAARRRAASFSWTMPSSSSST